MNSRHGPPPDGLPLPVALQRRQHEVQAVAGPGDCLAAAWTDDASADGQHGWTCGFAISSDGGRAWSTPLFHKHGGLAISGNPTIAADSRGTVHAVAMAVADDYAEGVLEHCSSADAGRTWSAWRTIVSKHGGIPDRPRLLATSDSTLHLVFAHVERLGRGLTALRSTIQICSSRDHARTWSAPRTIATGSRRSRWFISGGQGASIVQLPDSRLVCAWADYYGNAVSVVCGAAAGQDFEPAVRVRLQAVPGTSVLSCLLGASFGTPATELAADPTRPRMVLSVHEAHAMGTVMLLGSNDNGRTWQRLGRLTQHGTNACIRFDPAGRLHAIWTTLEGRRVDIRYASSRDGGRTFGDAVSLAANGADIDLPRSSAERDACAAALGSYQSLVITPQGRICAFWIDLRAGLLQPRLYQSSWQA